MPPLNAIHIAPEKARAIALEAQRLYTPAAFGQGIEAARRAIEHLGYVQIDTIAVVERAHHHVLWSRVPDYRPEWLNELLSNGAIYEYWSHAASVLPMRDFRFSLPRMRRHTKELHWAEDTKELRRAMKRVQQVISERGPTRLRDFENGTPMAKGVWGSGKIERRALHELWMRGTTMITGRGGFEKMYDLRDRVLPPGTDTSVPTPNQLADFVIDRTLRAHGIAREAEFHYMHTGASAKIIRARLAHAVKRRQIAPVYVGDSKTLAYAYPQTLETAPSPTSPSEYRARILSPFDNLVIQRARLRWLFDFDYQIECYVPASKRQYGHFVLPVLWGDRFAARLEAKARRAEAVLEVIGLWYEPGFEKDRSFQEALREELGRFASFNGCREVRVVSGF